jgi:hypothetical protein
VRLRSFLVAALVALGGCRSKEAPTQAASATLPEAPAPASLLAELSLGNPKQTWAGLRVLGGPSAEALPSSLPVLLTTSLSFPPAAASSLDESLPMVGVLLSRAEAAEPDAVLGMHVVSGAELVASLTLGDGAKFRRVELAPRVVRLVAAPGAQEFNGALGVSGNYLLVATRIEAMKEAGRFVAEVLPKRARTEPGLTLKAGERLLKARVASSLRDAWKRQRAQLVERAAGDRAAKGAPDFAEPEALLGGVDGTVESFIDVVESSRELSLSLVPRGTSLQAEVALTPSAGDTASSLFAREMVTGPLEPLLRLPANADAALMLSGDQKRAGGPGTAPLLQQLFGDRLKPDQAAKLTATLEAFDATRRGATTIALVTRPSPALLLQFELSSEHHFSSAFADLLKLSELGPVRSWLAGTWGAPTLQLGAVSEIDGAARLRFQRAAGSAPAATLPKSLSLAWEVRGNVGSVVISADDKLGVTPLRSAERLDAVSWLQTSRPDFAAQTGLALYLDAVLFGAPGGPDDAPVLLAMGKRGEQIVLRLDLSQPALATFSGFLR